jgi:tetratricopeptide (TPR) repeat protein
MAAEHPEPRSLELFMRDEVSAAERRRIVRHLLTGCPDCLEKTRRLWPLTEPGDPSRSYPGLFERLVREGAERERRIAAEREAAPRLLGELLGHPAAQRLARVCADPRFHSPALGEALIDRCRAVGADDAEAAIELGELAVALSEQVDVQLCGGGVVQGLKARSWAWLGNARRLASDLLGAERALTTAELLSERGAGDPLERAELLGLRAALLADQRAFNDAERLLDLALDLYRSVGERHLEGRTLVQKGLVRGCRAGLEAEGIELLREGVSLLDRPRGGRLLTHALFTLTGLLAEAGRPEEAMVALRDTRALCQAAEDRLNLIRLRRLEGKIEEAMGRPDAAEAALIEARDAFLHEGLGTEAAVASIDLAALYAGQGRLPEMVRLSENMSPVYRARDMRREIVATLMVFQRLIEVDPWNVPFLSEMSRYLGGATRARRPCLRWAS